MTRWGATVLALVCAVSLGWLLGGADRVVAQQQQAGEEQAWEIYHGFYTNASPSSDDARFYVIRHNRMTGETQYIGCEDRDGCTQLKVEIQD